MAHMYDEQVNLKADSPWSQYAKESIIPAVIPHAQVVKRLQNSHLCLFLDQESR